MKVLQPPLSRPRRMARPRWLVAGGVAAALALSACGSGSGSGSGSSDSGGSGANAWASVQLARTA